MHCPGYGFENPVGMNFCGHCGTKLSLRCPHCDFDNPPGFAFCGKCGASLVEPTPAAHSPSFTETIPRLQTATPAHLAEKILTSRAALTTAIELYKAMDMTFWLPQAEAGLAQVEGR